jgi:hypothetical protein
MIHGMDELDPTGDVPKARPSTRPGTGTTQPVGALVRSAPAEWKRLASLAVVAALAWVFAGSIEPLNGRSGGGWSTWTPTELTTEFSVSNRGILPIEVIGAVAPPGIERIVVLSGRRRVGPFDGGVLKVRADVADCAAIDRYERFITLRVRFLPIGPTRNVRVELPSGNPDQVVIPEELQAPSDAVPTSIPGLVPTSIPGGSPPEGPGEGATTIEGPPTGWLAVLQDRFCPPTIGS